MKSVKNQVWLEVLGPVQNQVLDKVNLQLWYQIRNQRFGEVEFGSVDFQVLRRVGDKMKYVL